MDLVIERSTTDFKVHFHTVNRQPPHFKRSKNLELYLIELGTWAIQFK